MTEKKKRRHFSIRIIIGILNKLLVFPEYSKLNKNLKYAYNSFNTPYFNSQLKRNSLLMSIAGFPSMALVGFVTLSMFRLPLEDIVNYRVSFNNAISNPSLLIKTLSDRQELHLQYTLEISIFLILTAILLSYILRKKNNLLLENIRFTKRFYKKEEEGEEEENQVFLNTPAGIIFFLGDRSIKELKEDKKFWESINMTPGEYKEDPFDSKIVFFGKGFALANKYIY
jgi:hypothetical protein